MGEPTDEPRANVDLLSRSSRRYSPQHAVQLLQAELPQLAWSLGSSNSIAGHRHGLQIVHIESYSKDLVVITTTLHAPVHMVESWTITARVKITDPNTAAVCEHVKQGWALYSTIILAPKVTSR